MPGQSLHAGAACHVPGEYHAGASSYPPGEHHTGAGCHPPGEHHAGAGCHLPREYRARVARHLPREYHAGVACHHTVYMGWRQSWESAWASGAGGTCNHPRIPKGSLVAGMCSGGLCWGQSGQEATTPEAPAAVTQAAPAVRGPPTARVLSDSGAGGKEELLAGPRVALPL